MHRIYWLFLAFIACTGMIMAYGCSDATAPAASGADGRLRLTLIDAPATFDSVKVTVVGVRVHRAGADSTDGWISVSDDTCDVDLLKLTGGNGVVIADTLLPAGRYTQIRLLLGDGANVGVDGMNYPLEVPSGATTGLKLNHPFTIAPDSIYAATLDFDAHRSVHRTGNRRWMLRPVIRVLVDAISGGLRGVVAPDSAAVEVWAAGFGDSARAWVDSLSGEFRFDMLREGLYDVTVVAADTAFADTTLAGVEVFAGATTDLDTIRVPFADQP
jgi:hypothetical protein